MFISIDQLTQSLARLEKTHPFFGMSLLLFAREQVPVGKTKEVVFARLASEMLDAHFKPSSGYSGYYTPFRPSSARGRWVKQGYNHTTLQRITTDTVGELTIHPKDASEWGWEKGYITGIKKRLDGSLIPAFDMGVWLFREHEWPDKVKAADVAKKLLGDFKISGTDLEQFFDAAVPSLAEPWISQSPITERQLLQVIGYPPGTAPEEGAALEALKLRLVGPADKLDYEPAERLNIITGDNSLGKTFLLECIWWALTGEWLERAAFPKTEVGSKRPSITFGIKTTGGTDQNHQSKFDWQIRDWSVPKDRKVLAGLVIYARHDGSFAVWDPAKMRLSKTVPTETKPWVLLDKHGLWNGVSVKSRLQGEEWVCNGLMRDWVTWQIGGDRYKEQYTALTACLEALSPSPDEPLKAAEPRRWFPMDSRDAPTLQMPYGPIPVQLASAGVQRVIGIAYVLVWAWFEHLAKSDALKASPQRRLVFLIDEAEAHLHPKWQRVILPALTRVIDILSKEITPQIHLATHSAMVMASAEAIFDKKRDGLHHLQLSGKDVTLEELPFVKRGTVDQWLVSDVFDLQQARSVPAELAIKDAVALQGQDQPDPAAVRSVNERLVNVLAPDDEFWPRWSFFAEKHGGQE